MEWNEEFNTYITSIGYKSIPSDPCIYVQREGEEFDILGIWVDNCYFICTKGCLAQVKAEIAAKFEATDQGEPHLLLGIKIDCDHAKGHITISQGEYIHKILAHFNMADCSPAVTLMDTSVKLKPTSDATCFEHPSTYHSTVGALLYAVMGTRPDIAYVVQTLSQFSMDPAVEHWTAVKKVFCYLQGTQKLGIMYDTLGGEATIEVTGLSDADWGNSPISRRLISGNVFLLGGGVISWISKKQTTVALSSMQAEYMSATLVTKHSLWLNSFFSFLRFPQKNPAYLYMDNKSAIDLTKNSSQFHPRSKHIDIRYHFISEKINTGEIKAVWCRTDSMTADILMKPLACEKFTKFTQEMGMATA
jgi:Reverse transcriptase (RNA-dependent DNA polymerase)